MATEFRALCESYITKLSSGSNTLEDVVTMMDQSTGANSDKKTCLDVALRRAVLNLVPNAESFFCADAAVKQYIDLAFQCSGAQYCTPSTPFFVLADVFDCLTLQRCSVLFSYIEDNSVKFNNEPLSNKNVLLRLCNDLIRRSSKSINTLFCGRIQMLLAQIFPISERSGLNLQSQFNTENVTEYSSEEKEGVMETDSEVSFLFYQTLWGMQDYFRNPNQISSDVQWKKMEESIKEICRVFESYKHEGSSQSATGETYFAKFLTSERLLPLQISDANFRRHILVQCLTLFRYLLADVKFKPNKLILSEPRKHWIRDTTANIYTILSETPPSGPQFVKHVQSVLTYEDKWSKWKNEGCPATAKVPDKAVAVQAKKKGIKRAVMPTDLSDTNFDLGTPTLTKLWNICPDNLAACQSSDRNFTPETNKFFEDAIEQLAPDSGVEKEYLLTNDTAFVWKSLRLLAGQSVPYFQHVQNTKNLTLTDNLTTIINLIGKDQKKENGVTQVATPSA